MGKGKIISTGGPVIRNAHLINAGNKFPNIKDTNGNIQWRISVSAQAQPQMKPDRMDKLLETTLKSAPLQNKATSKNIPTK